MEINAPNREIEEIKMLPNGQMYTSGLQYNLITINYYDDEVFIPFIFLLQRSVATGRLTTHPPLSTSVSWGVYETLGCLRLLSFSTTLRYPSLVELNVFMGIIVSMPK